MIDSIYVINPDDYRTLKATPIVHEVSENSSEQLEYGSPDEAMVTVTEQPFGNGDASGEEPAGTVYTIHLPIPEWTRQLERKFSMLVLRAANGIATEAEEKRLRELKENRRRLVSPRTAKEIAADYRRSQATNALIKALEQYAQVHRKT